MGKHLIRATRWSGRSLLRMYSRLLTLIFALFCAATGQLPKAKQTKTEPTIFRGTVYRASDSTLLSNIKLYLTDCYIPEYGIFPDYGVYPEYGVVAPLYGINTTSPIQQEEVTTDENGTFKIEYTGTYSFACTFSSEVVPDPGANNTYYSQGCIDFNRGKDSTYTLYLRNITTAAERKTKTIAQPSVMNALKGDMLQIRIPDWNGQTGTAMIVNTGGRKTATLTADPNGIMHWDTRPVAKGVYFLRLQDAHTNLSMKILVK